MKTLNINFSTAVNAAIMILCLYLCSCEKEEALVIDDQFDRLKTGTIHELIYVESQGTDTFMIKDLDFNHYSIHTLYSTSLGGDTDYDWKFSIEGITDQGKFYSLYSEFKNRPKSDASYILLSDSTTSFQDEDFVEFNRKRHYRDFFQNYSLKDFGDKVTVMVEARGPGYLKYSIDILKTEEETQ